MFFFVKQWSFFQFWCGSQKNACYANLTSRSTRRTWERSITTSTSDFTGIWSYKNLVLLVSPAEENQENQVWNQKERPRVINHHSHWNWSFEATCGGMTIILTVLKSLWSPLAIHQKTGNQKPIFDLVSGLVQKSSWSGVKKVKYPFIFWSVPRKQWRFFQFLFLGSKSARNGLYAISRYS